MGVAIASSVVLLHGPWDLRQIVGTRQQVAVLIIERYSGTGQIAEIPYEAAR